MKRIFLSSGELSSELHTELLLRAFARMYPNRFSFFGLGGKIAESAGLKLVENIVDRAVIGFAEAAKNLGYFWNLLKRIDGMMARKEMDGILLVDYPGLNLHIARLAARHRIPTVYFISPQVWAWRKGRAKTLARRIRKMLVIFPFEVPIYEAVGCPVEFVGHPFVDRVKAAQPRAGTRRSIGVGETETLLALLPGSRRQEVSRHFPVMWATVKRLARQKPVAVGIAVAPTIASSAYRYWMKEPPPGLRTFLIEDEQSRHNLIAASDLALVTTGTSTVETMLLGTPMIAGYRLSTFSYAVARLLSHVSFCAMPNILANDCIVPEFIQDRFTPDRLTAESERMLADPSRLERTRADLRRVAGLLGPSGAADRVAESAAAVFA